MSNERELKVYRIGHETVIHFDPEVINLGEGDLFEIGQEIYNKSSKRILLVVDLSSHGILSLYEDSAVPCGTSGLGLSDAEKIAVNRIKKCG